MSCRFIQYVCNSYKLTRFGAKPRAGPIDFFLMVQVQNLTALYDYYKALDHKENKKVLHTFLLSNTASTEMFSEVSLLITINCKVTIKKKKKKVTSTD